MSALHEVHGALAPTVPGCEILRPLKEGGMGKVYLARQEALNRLVCVKVLSIPDGEDAIRAKTENAWAHFECWFDGMPFERDPATGERLPAFDPEVHDSA